MRRLSIPTTIALVCMTAIVVAGCAYTPRATNETDSVLKIRADYLREHPDGRYNDLIMRGEVTQGMTFMEVLASWGVPDTRRQNKDKSTEYWGYITADEISGDWSLFTFTFEDQALIAWDTSRHVAKNGALNHWYDRDALELPKVPEVRRDPEAVAQKK